MTIEERDQIVRVLLSASCFFVTAFVVGLLIVTYRRFRR